MKLLLIITAAAVATGYAALIGYLYWSKYEESRLAWFEDWLGRNSEMFENSLTRNVGPGFYPDADWERQRPSVISGIIIRLVKVLALSIATTAVIIWGTGLGSVTDSAMVAVELVVIALAGFLLGHLAILDSDRSTKKHRWQNMMMRLLNGPVR